MKSKKRTKKIKGYDGSGFYIKKLQNYIIIVSNSISNPFEYIYELGKEVDKLSKKISTRKVQILFDLTPFMERKVIFSIFYDKDKRNFDLHSKKDIDEEELPVSIKHFLQSLYDHTNDHDFAK